MTTRVTTGKEQEALTPRPETRLQKVLSLLKGATVLLAEAVTEDDGGSPLRSEWIALNLRLANGKELTLIVSQDDEGNGPGALLGLWDFARKQGV